ncbi:Uncharacterised protein [Acetobacterium wieringae]|uniref:hypothetical protein n=1 Tax=Acetobacterium wieringae TaxID=52694 RepID=UPI001DD1B71A|nr:hypothetical protein [Acetobacterium wieringae]VUZ26478.1 Uncharacterised protein [Acetobacterium wieringae]
MKAGDIVNALRDHKQKQVRVLNAETGSEYQVDTLELKENNEGIIYIIINDY